MTKSPQVLSELKTAISSRPLILVATALILGVIAADCIGSAPIWMVAVTLVATVIAFVSPRARMAAAALIVAIAGFGGLLQAVNILPLANDISHLAGLKGATIRATVLSCRYRSEWRVVYVCQAHRVWGPKGQPLTGSGRAIVKLPGKTPLAGSGYFITLTGAQIRRPPQATNWFQPDRRRSLARKRIHAIIKAEHAEVTPGRSLLARITARVRGVRTAMLRTYLRAMPGEDAAERAGDAMLLASMVFGEDAARTGEQVRELFRRTGTIHLLVVSGAQVSIIVMFVVTLTGARLHLAWWHVSLIAPLILFFGLVVGAGPSIARALVMCGLWMVCMIAGRQYDLPSAIALAAVILVLVEPGVVFDIGAQLTFAATIGVTALLPPRYSRETGEAVRHHGIRSAAYGTFGALIFITPLLIHYFHNFALFGSLANIVAVPLSGIIVIVGLIAVIVGMFSLSVCTAVCWVAKLLMGAIVATNQVLDSIPLSFIDRLYLSGFGCGAWWLIAAAAVYLIRRGWLQTWWREKRSTMVTAAAVTGAVAIAVIVARETWPRPLRIVTFDVGEGQSTLIETPARHAVLIDAGGRGKLSGYEIARDVLEPYLLARGHRRLDLLVISHPDFDHYSAAPHLARRIPVQRILTTDRPGEKTSQRTLRQLQDTGAQLAIAWRGTSVSVGTARINVLSPPAVPVSGQFPPGDNNASLVLRLCLDGFCALLPGDAEIPGLKWLLQNTSRRSLNAQLLQVPHHGRDSADLGSFFRAVGADVAVVSRYGEPKQRAAHASCRRRCARVCSTEESGAIMIVPTEESLIVRTCLQ